MDGQDGVAAIVLAAEHLLDLAGLHFLLERVERLAELRVDRLPGLRPLGEDGEILAALLQRFRQLALLLEAAPPLQDFLRVDLILPEIRRGGARRQAG
jgi:hypothetical protein